MPEMEAEERKGGGHPPPFVVSEPTGADGLEEHLQTELD